MSRTPAAHRRAHARARTRRRRALALTVAAAAVVAAVGATVVTLALTGARTPAVTSADSGPSPSPSPSTPSPTPLTPEEQLLATTADPNACAVSFTGEGIALPPQLQTQGVLYTGLPIPRADGRVFAGWYATAADAAVYAIPGRVNGARLAECVDRRVTLHAAWKTPAENAAEDAGIPILMYHQFTTKPEGESNSLRLNYAFIGDFDAHMTYIKDNGFYLPTWDELSAFIDGALFLPKHSVIITDDDADSTWLELAAPIVHGKGLMTTSFVITKWRTEPSPNPYVLQRSHTQDMHEAGANGKGRMVNWTADQIAADLETSAQIRGAKEVIAYPFGHYNDTAKQGVAQAGFELARTIEQGYVRIGTDKLALPCIRINYGMGVDALRSAIG
ncbi:polysaccharide deacetylase family protein [Microbacterium sp. 10M-3C3]|uniref:polysaccharide deacetylase family protein n=1 Tax=Microbacterium sp. 10M-3C3 TaxID=2483401 RepID=UPI001F0BCFC2|nr:polysaccharide deacetylase family protein [Microbacterium sp. 10M-3C3]